MARVLKCRHCEKKDKEEKVKHVHTTSGGKSVNWYFHLDCYEEWKNKKKQLKKDNEELDKLVEVIKEVHVIESVPSQFYPYLWDLRNGNILFGKKGRKKNREGFSFEIIADTYKFCQESIRYWKGRKNFEGTLGELKYSFAIINDKINIVKRKHDKKKRKQELQEARDEKKKQQEFTSTMEDAGVDVQFKKKKRNDDITRFLD